MGRCTIYLLLILIALSIVTCKQKEKESTSKAVAVDATFFIQENLLSPITIEEVKLSGGTTTNCYKIEVRSEPGEHTMGPWCPRHIEDGKEKGGIWFEDGKVYDVDGHFIANIAEFYADAKWKLYNEDGSIRVTTTQEACEGAAKPNVEEAYKNHCVECMPSYYKDKITTYYIPVSPIYSEKKKNPGRGEPLGLAFNGVNFDPPAPTHAILAAHTVAPLDDCGGHVNPHGGYHYHAATGCTKKITQEDAHASMIGYALDGFGIFELLDTNGKEPTDLDTCHGHEDEVRGYHYHAGTPGGNQIIGCFHGETGNMVVSP
ncbi:hypothetical protein GCM10022393_15190 [Aquimarina addita]|uniref:YHYH domain-containing protein n=1 Tax=Aquimarina addita TaxID=870485 RepID=A0ABP7XGB6_9FLAO